MDNIINTKKKMKLILCKPASVYLLISSIAIIVIFLHNMKSQNKYCFGETTCNTSSIGIIVVIKIMYILFWTWILNFICKSGYTSISWLLVLIPLLLQFLFLLFFLPLQYRI